MSNNQYDLHESRLATTDERGHRVFLHPEDIKGIWKERRTVFYWFLIGVYLVLPWIYVDDKQWILLNLPKREFTIFGATFYGHDGPLLVFLALGFIFFIGFITSMFGRVWCGHACPQTVFIDAIFRKIERLIEGKARQRKVLDAAPMSPAKFFKKSIKWLLFLIASLHIVHSGLGYFVGTKNLIYISMSSPSENITLFITMLVLTGLVLLDFGWFREQFCIIACPYGRFQSVIMDEHSLVIAYDKKRGEPRREASLPPEKEGDCIDCKRCVKACPTGIDIRRGTQLECIACTMCIDACDEIMDKLHKPHGLIKYTSEAELKGQKRKVTPRSYLYAILFLIMCVGLFFSLNFRKNLQVQIIRGSHSPFQWAMGAQGEKIIANHFKVKLQNSSNQSMQIDLRLDNSNIELISPMTPIELIDARTTLDIFLRFNPSYLDKGHGKTKLQIIMIKNNKETILKTVEVKLVGPIK